MITLADYQMGRKEKYPDEWTPEIERNATALLEKVNAFLEILRWKDAKVNSGWRPAAVNGKIANAAKKSNHMIGFAIDLADPDGRLRELVLLNLEEAQKLSLYFEDFRYTKGWVHMQIVAPGSKKRIFVPSAEVPPHPKLWDGKYDPKYNG